MWICWCRRTSFNRSWSTELLLSSNMISWSRPQYFSNRTLRIERNWLNKAFFAGPEGFGVMSLNCIFHFKDFLLGQDIYIIVWAHNFSSLSSLFQLMWEDIDCSKHSVIFFARDCLDFQTTVRLNQLTSFISYFKKIQMWIWLNRS